MAELVCSNSLGSDLPDRALGVLKQELRRLGSLIIRVRRRHAVPAGGALAVDRDAFSQAVTDAIEAHPHITVVGKRLTAASAGPAGGGGNRTADLRAVGRAVIRALAGEETLYFFDAMAPIVSVETVDMSHRVPAEPLRQVEPAAESGNGRAARRNRRAITSTARWTKDEYFAFVQAVNDAEKISLREFEAGRRGAALLRRVSAHRSARRT